MPILPWRADAARGRGRATALAVDVDVVALGDRVDQFDLEAFALVREKIARLCARPDLLGEGLIGGHDGAHLRLDLGEILGREALFAIEIVIEAVLDHRADRDLGAGKKLLHRLGHHVCRVVADQLQRFRIVAGDDLDVGIGVMGR